MSLCSSDEPAPPPSAPPQAASLFDTSIDLPRYLDKSFYKTASLIAASCRSAAVFSECSTEGEQCRPGVC